ncbi:MAG: hypothetical protein J0I47_09260 [Sphingomonas sp.]|uniref:hypothetical protein n=1 Tax=Sphingomonas sp. TaxID=28214 RepID=UPI001AD35F32|nr:hypothetical protein [Sphingomonas sp.]MBN8808407.1 hypothetical protein [Sphingomonas sp.]
MATEYLLLLGYRETALQRLERFDGRAVRTPVGDDNNTLTDKSHLRLALQSDTTAGADKRETWWKTTSGTTGLPLAVPYAADFYLDLKYAVFHKAWQMAFGSRLGPLPYVALVITDLADEVGSLAVDPIHSNGIVARLSVDVSKPCELASLIDLAGSVVPEIVSTKPSVLAALVTAGGFRMAEHSLLIVGGAATSEELRRCAEETFRSRLTSIYATSEAGVIASECRETRMHVFESEVVVRDDHPAVPGELVVSNDFNSALAIRSYKTGDFGRISDEPCPCGAKWRWIESLDGRVVPLFHFADGTIMSPTRLSGLMRLGLPIEEFQVQLHHGRRVITRLQFADQEHDKERVLRHVSRFLSTELPSWAEIEVQPAVFAANEKFARYLVFA